MAGWLLGLFNPVTVIVATGLVCMLAVVLITLGAARSRDPEEWRQMDRAFHAYQRGRARAALAAQQTRRSRRPSQATAHGSRRRSLS